MITSVDTGKLNFNVLCKEPCMSQPPCQVFKHEGATDQKLAIILCLMVDPQCNFAYDFVVDGDNNTQAIMSLKKLGKMITGISKEVEKS